jgi:hypothetical protein
VIAFARTHAVALWAEFVVVALLVMALFVASYFGLIVTEESWGWMMLFGSLPWSVAATAAPGIIGMVIVAVGLGFNTVAATTVVCYAISWWLKTLRYNNDG